MIFCSFMDARPCVHTSAEVFIYSIFHYLHRNITRTNELRGRFLVIVMPGYVFQTHLENYVSPIEPAKRQHHPTHK